MHTPYTPRGISAALPVLLLIATLLLSACGGGGQAALESAREDTNTQSADGDTGSNSAPAQATAAPASGRTAAEEAPMEEMEEAEPMAEAEPMEEAAAEEDTILEDAEAEEAPADEGMDMAEDEATAGEAAPPAPQAAAIAEGDAAESGAVTGIAAPTPAPTQAPQEQDIPAEPLPPTETAPEVETNPFVNTVDDNLSTFAMDVDTASYSAARNYIGSGSLPPADTVRVEEFVNYFRYGYAAPQDEAFSIIVDAAPSPFGAGDTQMVRVGLQGKRIDDSQRKDAVLTFVIDVSGSMADANRLPLVKRSLGLLVEQLREGDQVAIVVYSDDTRAVLEPTSATQADTIMQAINSLSIEGSTNVEAGLRLGYQVASDNFRTDAINRVILCSDGVANVGATGPEAIRESVRDYAAQGVLLTTVGFGMGDFNDYMMEQLANDGNGNYAYVDTLDEAERVFVENLTGTLQVIAQDAKIQVEFNPEVVSQYRLLGYENRAVADADFRNDDVDAGEVGAGHSVTALYEVRLTQQASGNAMNVQLRYEDVDDGEIHELSQPFASSDFAQDFAATPPSFQLAVAVAGFAENLRGSGYAQDRPLGDILAIAERVAPQYANDNDVQEFVGLVQQAQQISAR